MAAADVVVPTSASSALFLLDEPEHEIQAYALETLNAMADSFWPEISPYVAKIQALSEDKSFSSSALAAIVAAKVLFHLGELDEALEYALSAGNLFDVTANNQFALTLRAKCIDEYIRVQIKRFEVSASTGASSSRDADALAIPAGLEQVVDRVLDDCVVRGEVREAIGIAIEARRLDRVEYSLSHGCTSSSERIGALKYCFDCVQGIIAHRAYRHDVLKLIAALHRKEPEPDEVAIARCYAFIENASGVAECLFRLLEACGESKKSRSELFAYQIACDVYDNDAPHFAQKVAALLPAISREDDVSVDSFSEPDMRLVKLRAILSGIVYSAYALEFLYSENHSDMFIMQSMKSTLDNRSSLNHSALIFANSIAHAGTTVDTFLRENLDWLARASSWSKFSATACLGVIHSRHATSAMKILSPYLSSTPGVSSSAYAEGGAFYALGLISATSGSADQAGEHGRALLYGSGNSYTKDPFSATKYLLVGLREASSNEIIQHGGCLGLGLAAMGTWDGSSEENEIYEELKGVLFSDSAVSGEAAGVGMGLVALGSGSEKALDEMIAYARDTEHEKIKRGLAMGIAMVCYGRENEADAVIEKLASESEAILRYSAMFCTALAYAATADNKAVRLLLHSAVSDVDNDVRRAAVIALGFVLMRHPRQVPRTIALLAESCHAHVRYGATLALGIACAGTGLPAAIEILEKLASDTSDFVRQGALIGLALVLMQHSEARSSKSAEARKLFQKMYSDRHEEAMTKFGAVLANGFIDAGGRNATVSLLSRSGHRRASAIVGMAMFVQFWFWFPFVHFIALALKPAAIIGLDSELKMPMTEVKVNCRPSLYAYPRNGPLHKSKKEDRAASVVLSITAKAKAREARKAQGAKSTGASDAAMDTTSDGGLKNGAGHDAKAGSAGDIEGKVAAMGVSESKPPKEDTSYTVSLPARMLPDQEKYVVWPANGRFQPVQSGLNGGFVMLLDSTPEEEAIEHVKTKTWTYEQATESVPAQPATTEDSLAASSAPQPDSAREPEPPAAVFYPEDANTSGNSGT
uniref:26S proteasome regulatory subunit RPN2 C-terminal domain-containing protein n=1 Tax=Erythrolobus australicus TaxID=1077150 RepID=A0A7S1TLY8_9RHOD|mmetsp:Transcript_3819/g.10527  ORF Transcript_3819/g.10527 Transcript_3819/m.10527 type:complete len:1043 (+) Transcript_3819:359-3487(+)